MTSEYGCAKCKCKDWNQNSSSVFYRPQCCRHVGKAPDPWSTSKGLKGRCSGCVCARVSCCYKCRGSVRDGSSCLCRVMRAGPPGCWLHSNDREGNDRAPNSRKRKINLQPEMERWKRGEGRGAKKQGSAISITFSLCVLACLRARLPPPPRCGCQPTPHIKNTADRYLLTLFRRVTLLASPALYSILRLALFRHLSRTAALVWLTGRCLGSVGIEKRGEGRTEYGEGWNETRRDSLTSCLSTRHTFLAPNLLLFLLQNNNNSKNIKVNQAFMQWGP